MEKKVVIFATIATMVITITMISLFLYFPDFHVLAVSMDENWYTAVSSGESVLDLMRESSNAAEMTTVEEDVEVEHELRLELPGYVTSASVSVDNVYIDKTIYISIKGVGSNYIYDYPMMGKSDHIVDVTFSSVDATGIVGITFDKVLEPQMTVDDRYLYFDFLEPHEVYDYVVVVDAGHGGHVPGATKQGVSEKNIDLDIVLELKKLFDKSDENIGVYYTRVEDVNPSFDARVGLANDSGADLFISVHNNSTASGRMSGISGTEVMYKATDETGASKAFASSCLSHLLDELGSKSKGTVVGDEIYIIRMSEVPVALVEVGFMTNQQELDLLTSKDYQKKAAKAMYDAIMETLNSVPR